MSVFLIQAKVTKLVTDDGLMPLNDDVSLGDVFVVDLDTKDDVQMLYNDAVVHTKTVIQCIDDGGWFPMECLELFT